MEKKYFYPIFEFKAVPINFWLAGGRKTFKQAQTKRHS